MGKLNYPFLPIKLILKDKFNSKEKIKNIKIPTLVMHGKKDTIVPFYMGEDIYNSLKTNKYSHFVDNDDHMMRFDSRMKEVLNNFLKELN